MTEYIRLYMGAVERLRGDVEDAYPVEEEPHGITCQICESHCPQERARLVGAGHAPYNGEANYVCIGCCDPDVQHYRRGEDGYLYPCDKPSELCPCHTF